MALKKLFDCCVDDDSEVEIDDDTDGNRRGSLAMERLELQDLQYDNIQEVLPTLLPERTDNCYRAK